MNLLMKNNKGITLVELLTVLIILIIIFLLAIIKVNDAMDDAEIKAVKASAISYVKAVNDTFILKNGLLLFPEYEGIYTYENLTDMGVKVTGTKPVNGYILNINNKTVYGCLRYKDRRAIIKNDLVTDVDTKDCKIKNGYNSDLKAYLVDYTGNELTYTVPTTGRYKIEVWGAQGGNAQYLSNSTNGGYGGYSVGTIILSEGDILYINVGGQGRDSLYTSSGIKYGKTSGYNGGGYATYYSNNSTYAGGGGATSIAKVTGLLTDLSSNVDDILIVAGGGGGAGVHDNYPNYSGDGGSGGGSQGSSGTPKSNRCYQYGIGGNQDSAGSFSACLEDGRTYSNGAPAAATFGKGGNFTSNVVNGACYSGGGGGFYGGGAAWHGPAAGGSGYIGNTSLTNKLMACYNCDESDSLSTKTISVTCAKDEPNLNCAKKGNGYARIILIEEYNSNNS